MKTIIWMLFLLLPVSAFSAATDGQYLNPFTGYYYSSASAVCSVALPARVVSGTCTMTNTAGTPSCASATNGVKCTNSSTYSLPCTVGTVQNTPGTLYAFQCAAPKIITGSCPSYACECPAGKVEENGLCVNQCNLPNVLNPFTKQCQLPCESQSLPPGTLVGVSVSVDSADTCVSGCKIHHDLWQGKNSKGYDASELLSYRTGDFCATGDPSPPTVPPPTCPPPNVDTGGYCQPPPCPAWQERINGQCQNKSCPDGKTMKCGVLNGSEHCSCAGITECPSGQQKDAFGNCIALTCPADSPFNPATGTCQAKNTGECPAGQSKVGLVCVKDDPTKPVVSDDDLDGDGIKNRDDPDMDNDSKPNSSDSDKDGDGIPNDKDTTPEGPGSAQEWGPSAGPEDDYDGDGIKNKDDGDKDGDGIPNGQDATPNGGPSTPPGGGQCNPAIQQCGTGTGTGQCDPATQNCGTAESKPGAPVSIGGAFYEKKSITFPDIWDKFMSTINNAPIITAGSGFLSVSDVSGSCPNWSIPATPFNESIEITIQCSEQVSSAFRVAGTIFLLVCAWLAFRIALIEG